VELLSRVPRADAHGRRPNTLTGLLDRPPRNCLVGSSNPGNTNFGVLKSWFDRKHALLQYERNTDADRIAPHERPAADVAAELGTDLKAGLSSPEAQARLERYGRTSSRPKPRRLPGGGFSHSSRRAGSPARSGCAHIMRSVGRGARHELPYEGMVIFTIVLLNAILALCRRGGRKGTCRFAAMAAPEASVVRDGEQRR